MYTAQQQNHGIRNAIIASLLIHLLLGTAATMHIYFTGPRNQQEPSLPDLRAGQSTYGATVIFENLPEQQETEKEPYPFDAPDGNSLTRQDEESNLVDETEKQEVSVQSNFDIVQKSEEINEVGIPQQLEEPKTIKQVQRKHGLPPRNPFARGRKNVSPAIQMSLAALAKGFIEHVKHQGNDSVNSRGSRMPDFGDMQYISYLQRIGRNIQDSIRRNNRVFNVPYDIHGITTVQFGIGRDGNLIDLKLQNPTGIPDLDGFFRQCVQDAAPFPPLPKHFTHTIFARQISFHLNMPQGVHRNPRWVAH